MGRVPLVSLAAGIAALTACAPAARRPVGRLQIPRDHLDALSIAGRDRVRVDLEDAGIAIHRAGGESS